MGFVKMNDLLSLTDTAVALREFGLRPTYQHVWRAVVAGDIPAQKVGKKWKVMPADLPSIAQTLAAKA